MATDSWKRIANAGDSTTASLYQAPAVQTTMPGTPISDERAIDGDEGVAELAEHYAMSFAAVQKRVAILERAGLVSKHRIGRQKVVRANFEGAASGGAPARWLRRAVWRERGGRTKELINESPKESDR